MAEGSDETSDPRALERKRVREWMDHPLIKGETWYLIDVRWFNQWKCYVEWEVQWMGETSAQPGPIDNSPLLADGELKERLVEDMDYVMVPEAAWKFLVEQYSLSPGQEPIGRRVVDQGLLSSYLQVEIYLLELRLAKYPETEKTTSRCFSKTDTLESVEKVFRQAYDVPGERQVRLWTRLSSTQPYEDLQQKKQTIQELSLTSKQVIVGEVQNEDGTWPKKVMPSYSKRTATGTSSYSSRYIEGDSSSSSRYVQPGLCGLNNLGNTCFMNSVLQCMSNTPPIARYFLEDAYVRELNRDNPLGNQGEIAKAFADLLKAMWSGQYQSFAPRAFKLQVGRFAPQFSGYQQHDSQELLTFLLDGLHEDLNRIVKKPYIEMRDADGRSDEEVAKEAWENYRKRNDSVIVDLFHGLLKSTLVCPECGKVSVTFDPTCYLSLPLPVKKERSMEVTLVPLDPERKPVRYRVTVPKSGNVHDLTEALSKLCRVPAERLVVADIYQHRIRQMFTPESHLLHINDRHTIYVYELAEKLGSSGTCCLTVEHKEIKSKNSYGYGPLFGTPLILQVPRAGVDYDQIYNGVVERMKRYVRPDLIESDKTEDEAPAAAQTDLPSANGTSDETEMEVDDADETEDADWDEAEAENGNAKSLANGVDSAGPTSAPRRYLFRMEMPNTASSLPLGKLKSSGKSFTLPTKSELTCDWDPSVKEACYDLDLSEETDEDASFQQKPAAKKQVLQLRECLELFTTTERLGADDAWYCPACKKHQRATKKFDLWSLPDVLVIHLKRFSYTRSLRDKLDTLVEFPAGEFDMTSYVINPNHPRAVYDLIGVCNHYGGLGGGHYTAFAKNKDDGRWYYFDDSSVSESNEEAVCSKAAYVLFYMRRNSQFQTAHLKSQPPTSSSPIPVRKAALEDDDGEDEDDMDSS